MMNETPRRRWWRKKRWIAAAIVLLAVTYPLSFVPACWVLMRTDSATDPLAWGVIREGYRPIAFVVKWSPDAVRGSVVGLVNRGRPEIIGGIDVGYGRITVDLVKFRLAEPGLTVRTHSYTAGHTVW